MVRTVERVAPEASPMDAAIAANSPRFMQVVEKQLAIDEKARTVTMLISREVVDRDNEMVLLRGIDLDAFRKNPVVLFMHDPSAVIGKAESITVRKRDHRHEMIGKVLFAETDTAEEVFQLVKGGFLSGASLALSNRSLEMRHVTPDDIRKNPELADADVIITKGELIEFSVVSIPANQEALATAVSKGLVNHTKRFFETLYRPDRRVARPVVRRVKMPVVRVAPETPKHTIRRVGTTKADQETMVRRVAAYRAGRI